MKQLEQEAHRAAGQIFLLTSNSQLRIVRTSSNTSVCSIIYTATFVFQKCKVKKICMCLFLSAYVPLRVLIHAMFKGSVWEAASPRALREQEASQDHQQATTVNIRSCGTIHSDFITAHISQPNTKRQRGISEVLLKIKLYSIGTVYLSIKCPFL